MKLSLSDLNEIKSYLTQKENENITNYETETISDLLSDLITSKEKIQEQEELLNLHELKDRFNNFMMSSDKAMVSYEIMEFTYYEDNTAPDEAELNALTDSMKSLVEDGLSLSSELINIDQYSSNYKEEYVGDPLCAVEQKVMDLKSVLEQLDMFKDMCIGFKDPEMEF